METQPASKRHWLSCLKVILCVCVGVHVFSLVLKSKITQKHMCLYGELRQCPKKKYVYTFLYECICICIHLSLFSFTCLFYWKSVTLPLLQTVRSSPGSGPDADDCDTGAIIKPTPQPPMSQHPWPNDFQLPAPSNLNQSITKSVTHHLFSVSTFRETQKLPSTKVFLVYLFL